MSIQPGERVPEAVLQYIHDGVQKVDTITLFDGNKTVLFSVPGAFTPTCSERHLPGFVEHYDEFRRRGINVACMAVNDPFVMEAWGESQHVPEGLRMLSDGNGEFSLMGHVQKGSLAVKVGDVVKRGQLVARIGSSGSSNNPHVHYELRTGKDLKVDGLPATFVGYRRHLGTKVIAAQPGPVDTGDMLEAL